MVPILLSGTKKESSYALVDREDAQMVSMRRWNLGRNGYVCAGRTMDLPDGTHRQRTVYLHRVLLGLRRGDRRYVDHINRDRLDNRRGNLRILSTAESAQNITKRKGTTSRFRGVTWAKHTKRWRARLTIAGKKRFLGDYASEEAAGRIASEARLRLMPFTVET